MLDHSFSYLPVYSGNGWQFVSDINLVQYLRVDGKLKTDRLAQALRDAIAPSEGLRLEHGQTCLPDAQIAEVLASQSNRPILVVRPDDDKSLMGIVTGFDLL